MPNSVQGIQVLLDDKTYVRDPSLAITVEEAEKFQDIGNPPFDAMVNEPYAELELIGHCADPLPITVIAELLGVPVKDRPQFRAWSTTKSRATA